MPVYSISGVTTKGVVGGSNCIRDYLLRYYDARDLNSATNNTAWNDISGNNQDSSAGTAPTWGSYYFDFDGTDDYWEFPALSFTENSAFSMEMWINFDGWANPRGGLFMCGAFGDSYGFDNNGSGVVRFGIRPAGSLFNVEASSLSTGVWYFFSGTYDGGGNGGVVKLYKNGVLVGTATNTHTSLSTSEALRVGYNQVLGGSSTGADTFNGKISALRVYNKELSQDEVLYNFNSERGAFAI